MAEAIAMGTKTVARESVGPVSVHSSEDSCLPFPGRGTLLPPPELRSPSIDRRAGARS